MNGHNNLRHSERDRSSSSSSHLQQRQLNFNSTRTAWVLSLLLLLTLITQALLIAYHEDFVVQLNSLEGEFLEDMAVVNSIATGVLNAAHEYNDGDNAGGTAVVHRHAGSVPDMWKKERITKYSNYSMEPIDILNRAGVDHLAGFVPSITVREARAARNSNEKSKRQQAELPTLESIQSMYGNHSYVLGLDRCEEFRDTVDPEHRLMGPAGMFNSATNLLNKLLKLNCVNEARLQKRHSLQATGMLLQAPWGKHNPVTWRLHHEAAVGGKGVQQADFLPVVMIKDPITWMASMCRHPYETRWRHTNAHCPNLVPNKFDKGRKVGEGTMALNVKFATQHIGLEPIPDKKNRTFVQYKSLVELWNIWYNDWHDASFPRLMVRFEDLIFHAEETISQVCACGGGTMKPKFRYVEESAKGTGGPHAGSAGFLASLVTYGNKTLRMKGILTDDRDTEYAREHLDKDLMDVFGYAPI